MARGEADNMAAVSQRLAEFIHTLDFARMPAEVAERREIT